MCQHAQLTAREISGPYSQLLVNLLGKDGGRWLTALNRFLRKENAWDGKPLFPIWRTVRVGQFKTLMRSDRSMKKKVLRFRFWRRRS